MKCDRISPAVIRKLYENAMKEERLSSYKFPDHKSSDGYYHIWVKDATRKGGRRQLKAKTIDILKDKVYEYETGGISSEITFKDVYKIYHENITKFVKDKDKKASAINTAITSEKNYRRFFSGEWFENLPIRCITAKDIKRYTLEVLTRYDLKRQSFYTYKSILTGCFMLALDEEWLDISPLPNVNFGSRQFLGMLIPDVDIEKRMHSDEDISRMLAYLQEKESERTGHPAYYAVEFQILTGCRRAEVCAMKWSDLICIDGKWYLEIRRELLKPHYVAEHTKTGKVRRLPVWDELSEFFSKLKKFHGRYFPKSVWMFPDFRDDSRCLNLETEYYTFYRMCNVLGIKLSYEFRKGTHAFRRSFAKRIDDAEMASKLLGNDERVLRRNYYDGLNMEKALSVLNSNQLTTKVTK